MKLWLSTLRLAGRSLRRNPLRSGLTSLGVVVGVAAVIAMVSVGQGAHARLQEQLASVGTNIVMVFPGATSSSGARAGWGTADPLTVADARAIERQVPGLRGVSYFRRGVVQVQGGGASWSTTLWGVPESFSRVREWPVQQGAFLQRSQDEAGAKVVVLGATVAEKLFGVGQDPVGAEIRVKDVPFRVVGVLEEKGQTVWGRDQDDAVFVPFTTAERKVLGAKRVGNVDMIRLGLQRSEEEPRIVDELSQLLRQRRRVQPGEDDDFAVRTMSEMSRTAEGTAADMSNLLLAIASISLVVGGIGIMNVLLVAVSERTREIGIRMAVGAKRRHILLQFLCEAVALSGLGGLVGVVLGVMVSVLISQLSDWPTLISPASIVGACLFSCAVGVFFGYYPARKASRLDPIEALHHE
ncbi:MAG: ABC transporter permease [Candidatus Binatia bacterium]|nr:ABC transporter permease [Candidatus Binatia bacterium]